MIISFASNTGFLFGANDNFSVTFENKADLIMKSSTALYFVYCAFLIKDNANESGKLSPGNIAKEFNTNNRPNTRILY